MKTFFLSFLTLVLAWGCGSSSSKKVAEVPKSEFDLISNDDFRQIDEVPYQSYQDVFNYPKETNDSLVRESLARVEADSLESAFGIEDPISHAISLCYQGKIAEGLSVLDGAFAKYKSHPSYWNQIGTCYFLKKDYRKALLYYNQSLEIDRKYAPPINNLGVIYLRQGKDQKALVAFEQAAKNNRLSLTPIFNMAQLYLEYGLIDKALRLFNALRNQGRFDQDIIGGTANAYLMKGNAKQAYELFSSMDERSLVKPEYGLNFAVASKILGKSSNAQRIFENVNKGSSKGWRLYYNKVRNYIQE